MADEVRLVDLEVIKKYSLAVRQESAPADDLLAALDASREAVLASMHPVAPRPSPRRPRTAKTSKATKSAKAKNPAEPLDDLMKAATAG